MGFLDWLFGKQRGAAPERPGAGPVLRPPKAVYGLDDGSPQVVVDTGKIQIIMDRAQFDAVSVVPSLPQAMMPF